MWRTGASPPRTQASGSPDSPRFSSPTRSRRIVHRAADVYFHMWWCLASVGSLQGNGLSARAPEAEPEGKGLISPIVDIMRRVLPSQGADPMGEFAREITGPVDIKVLGRMRHLWESCLVALIG